METAPQGMPRIPFNATLENPIVRCTFTAGGTATSAVPLPTIPMGDTRIQKGLESCQALLDCVGMMVGLAADSRQFRGAERAHTQEASLPMPQWGEGATLDLHLESNQETPAVLLHAIAHALLMVANYGWGVDDWQSWLMPAFATYLAIASSPQPDPEPPRRRVRRHY